MHTKHLLLVAAAALSLAVLAGPSLGAGRAEGPIRVTGTQTEVDLAKVGLAVQALIAFQVRPLSRQVIQGFQAFALSLPQVRAVYVLTGNDDFLIHVAVPDLPALHGLLMDHFSKRREVIGFRTSVIYDYASQPLLTVPARE